MTQPRHPLHPSSAVQLAAVALAEQGEYGTVTDLAREHGLRRQQVYGLRERGRAALEAEFVDAEPEAAGSFTLDVTRPEMERVVVALRVVTPASVRDIVAMLPIMYGVSWSYGKVWDVLNVAEQRAARCLSSVNLFGVQHVALDEMFSQGRPVLAGIDLDTQYLFQLEVQDSRSGDTWAQSLGKLRDMQRLCPEVVVKDAGSGLASGVEEAWPCVEQRDDLFHAVYKAGVEAYHLERGAYRAIGVVEDLIRRRDRAQKSPERRKIDQKLCLATVWMDEAISRYDRFEVLHLEAERALELADRGSGRLRTSAEVVETLTRVAREMQALGGKRVCSVAKYLANRAVGLGRYLDALATRLKRVADEVGDTKFVDAAVRAYQASLAASRKGPEWDRKAREQELHAAAALIRELAAQDMDRTLMAIGAAMPELAHRHRASSAIENLNSVLRPYLVVQKHAEQGFLNLFRFHWNTRKREWGRGKGTSAHEQLTGEKVDDWLALLGYPPRVEVLATAA